uniref:hypothetical protein n=1 Tax=uncultured Allisonella sp. TaxID=339338 RepID=UPI002596784D|nr:hypothetical protein [uncultured Allisonella sp.]
MREEQVREMGAGMDMFSVPGGKILIMAGLAVCLAIKEGWPHSDYKRRMILPEKEKETK